MVLVGFAKACKKLTKKGFIYPHITHRGPSFYYFRNIMPLQFFLERIYPKTTIIFFQKFLNKISARSGDFSPAPQFRNKKKINFVQS